MGQSATRNPVFLEQKSCPLCSQVLTPSHPLFCSRSAGKATIGRHNASLRVLRSIFSKHYLALTLEKRICEPVRPHASGSDRGKYSVRMDGIFAFKNGKVVEVDFTWGAAAAPSYLRKSLLGKLPAKLEADKQSDYDDRVLHNPSCPRRPNVQFIPLACVYPTNQWGEKFDGFIKSIKKEVNGAVADIVDQTDRLKFQAHWIRGRLAVTAARFNFQAVCDWERKVTSKLDRIAQGDSHLLATSAIRDFPSEARVFDDDYGFGTEDGIDGGLQGDGRDLPDGDAADDDRADIG